MISNKYDDLTLTARCDASLTHVVFEQASHSLTGHISTRATYSICLYGEDKFKEKVESSFKIIALNTCAELNCSFS